ncbi:MAG: S9 family peptidase [Ignavibacteriales bacterium]|nr:S9 family peptidase [Ignavibacteriales bacterium]
MMRRLLCLIIAFVPFVSYPQEGVIPPGDNLVIDGVPPIPQSIADAVGRYTEFRAAGILSWHPTKAEMLVSTRFGESSQIHHVRMPGGARTQLTFFPERVSGGRFNPKNPDYFVFSKDVGGGEWFQNYRYDVLTGATTLLTDGSSRNSLGVWSRDGSRMAYTSTRRNGKDVDLYVINPADPSSDRLVAENQGGGWFPSDWFPDNSTVLVVEYVSINETYLWLFNAETGERILVTPKGKQQVFYGGGEFSRDGKGLYTSTDLDSEFRRLAYFDLSTKKFRFMTSHITWDVDNYELSPDGKTLAFITNEDGVGVLHLIDAVSGKELPVPPLPTGIVSGIRWHPLGTHLGFNFTSARSSTDAYSLEIASGKVDRWTASETGGINTGTFAEAELIKWKSFDGRTISGFLYRPPSSFTGKRPVIVNVHGGPEGQARPGFLGRNNYYLNEMGLVIIYPNVRGSSGYGKTFLKLDNGFDREGSYKDLAALFDWIKTQQDLDGDRIMVTGGSYGGHATLAVATHYPEKIRCAVDIVGMSNLVTFLERTESYRRDLRRAEYGDERDPKMRRYLESIAPMNRLDKLTKPLFVIQGKNDPRVPAFESEQIVSALKSRNTPAWYLMANDEGHGFAKRRNQDYQFYATVMFIKEYLLQ